MCCLVFGSALTSLTIRNTNAHRGLRRTTLQVPTGANGVPAGVRVSANFPLTRPRPPPVVPVAAPDKAPSNSAPSLTAPAEGAEKVQRVEERVTDPDDPFADEDSSIASSTPPSPRESESGALSPRETSESRALSPRETSEERDASAAATAAEEERAAIAAEVDAEFHRRSRAEQCAHAGVKSAYYSSDASLVVPPEVLDGVWLKPNPGTLTSVCSLCVFLRCRGCGVRWASPTLVDLTMLVGWLVAACRCEPCRVAGLPGAEREAAASGTRARPSGEGECRAGAEPEPGGV